MFPCQNPSTTQFAAQTCVPASTERIARNVAQRFAWSKIATIVIRDVPEVDWAWGWFGNQLEPRMAIEPMDVGHRRSGRIYLETPDGRPAFEPTGKFCGIDLARLRKSVEANRPRIETLWVTTMCYKGWLHIKWDRSLRHPIRIIAYFGTQNERVHDLAMNWRAIIGNREPQPGDIAMDRANASLVLGTTMASPIRVQLASVLWPERQKSSDQPQSIGPRQLLTSVYRRLPTDYEPYGDRVRNEAGDCSCGCRHYLRFRGETGQDWGACGNSESPRAGLMTFEHQGCERFEAESSL